MAPLKEEDLDGQYPEIKRPQSQVAIEALFRAESRRHLVLRTSSLPALLLRSSKTSTHPTMTRPCARRAGQKEKSYEFLSVSEIPLPEAD